jgi:voltage-gated potassium channel
MMTNTEVQPNASNQGFRFVMLLLALLFLILVPPHFYQVKVLNQVWGFSTSLVMLVALYSLAGRRSAFLWLMILLVPSFIANWLQVLSDNRAALYADNVTTILYFSLVGFHLVRYIMYSRVVTSNIIYAALCPYMILAVIWGAAYNVLYLYYAMSFGFSSEALMQLASQPETMFFVFNYYSIVTLTTLGYGDNSPLTPITRAWVGVEAILGQFFIAVIIARLIGGYYRGDNGNSGSP